MSHRASAKLDEARERLEFIDSVSVPFVLDGEGTVRIWTFAGGLANAAIAQAMPGPAARADDFSIMVRDGDVTRVGSAFAELQAASIRPSVSDEAIQGLKFSTCHPDELAAAVVQGRLLDVAGIRRTLDRDRRLIAGTPPK